MNTVDAAYPVRRLLRCDGPAHRTPHRPLPPPHPHLASASHRFRLTSLSPHIAFVAFVLRRFRLDASDTLAQDHESPVCLYGGDLTDVHPPMTRSARLVSNVSSRASRPKSPVPHPTTRSRFPRDSRCSSFDAHSHATADPAPFASINLTRPDPTRPVLTHLPSPSRVARLPRVP
jgi:hypothetical protein